MKYDKKLIASLSEKIRTQNGPFTLTAKQLARLLILANRGEKMNAVRRILAAE